MSVFARCYVLLLLATISMACTSKKCYKEPFPRLLEQHIRDLHQCGLNNPFIVDYACEPIPAFASAVPLLERNIATQADPLPEINEDKYAYQAGVVSASARPTSSKKGVHGSVVIKQWADNYTRFREAGLIGSRKQ